MTASKLRLHRLFFTAFELTVLFLYSGERLHAPGAHRIAGVSSDPVVQCITLVPFVVRHGLTAETVFVVVVVVRRAVLCSRFSRGHYLGCKSEERHVLVLVIVVVFVKATYRLHFDSLYSSFYWFSFIYDLYFVSF